MIFNKACLVSCRICTTSMSKAFLPAQPRPFSLGASLDDDKTCYLLLHCKFTQTSLCTSTNRNKHMFTLKNNGSSSLQSVLKKKQQNSAIQ